MVFVLDDIKAPDGIWLSIDAMPLTDEDGVLHNGVAILHNITAQQEGRRRRCCAPRTRPWRPASPRASSWPT